VYRLLLCTVQALAQYLVNLNVWTHNLLVLLARKGRVNNSQADLLEESFVTEVRCSDDHKPGYWAVASLFVIAYSYAISMSVPFFSSLVGIVASTTYLVCAYALPCWFALTLFGSTMRSAERLFCKALIPTVLVISLFGFISSVSTLIRNIQSQGSGFGPESG
jgi:vesicular inhibitory amino acid transporter